MISQTSRFERFFFQALLRRHFNVLASTISFLFECSYFPLAFRLRDSDLLCLSYRIAYISFLDMLVKETLRRKEMLGRKGSDE